MSKLLYIHKPSLTAIIQYNPHPEVEKIATVDLLQTAERVIGGKTAPMGSQPQAVLACFIKRRLNATHTNLADFQTPTELALWFSINHPQALDECSFRRQGNNNDEREAN
jgi:hypothetical protein